MRRRACLALGLGAAVALAGPRTLSRAALAAQGSGAESPVPSVLPAPASGRDKTLLAALKARRSTRSFSAEELPPQLLADLLWAAFGVNRPQSGKRTAPSALDWREMDVYATLAAGAYRYDAVAHKLVEVAAGDLRSLTGRQSFAANAPLNLVYVSDMRRVGRHAPQEAEFYAWAHAGAVSQNVSLVCAAEGLATVLRAWMDRPALAKALALAPEQKIIMAQSVGHPA